MPAPVPSDQNWNNWAQATLAGLGAPTSSTNLQSLAAWTQAEKPAGQPMQWNNPLNTKQQIQGSINAYNGVQQYPDWQSAAAATVSTLTNGLYPNIISALKQSIPRAAWGPGAQGDLNVWRTGNRNSGGGSGFYSPGFSFSGFGAGLLNPVQAGALAGAGAGGAVRDAVTTRIIASIEVIGGGLLIAVGFLILGFTIARGVTPAAAQLTPIGRGVGRVASYRQQSPGQYEYRLSRLEQARASGGPIRRQVASRADARPSVKGERFQRAMARRRMGA